MIDIKLKKWTSYINTLNYFTKGLIIKNNLNYYKNIVIVCEWDKNIREYKKIMDFLHINFSELQNRNDLTNLINMQEKLFFCNSENIQNTIVDNAFLETENLSIYINYEISIDNLIKNLNKLNYKFWEYNNPWTYKKLWDTLTITSFNWNINYKISFWWDKIEEISTSDIILDNPQNTETIKKIIIGSNISLTKELENKSTTTLQNIIKENIDYFCILDQIDFTYIYDELISTWTNIVSFDYIWNKQLSISDLEISKPKIDNIDIFLQKLKEKKKNIYIYTKNTDSINNFINYNNISNIVIHENKVNNVKSFECKNTLVLCDDIINELFIRKRIKKSLSTDLDLLLKISPEDYIVHIDHWIWIFKWIIEKQLWDIKKEYVEIEYKWEDKLFVPITEVSRINKYVWVNNPKLTGLNTREWQKKLDKANINIQAIAEELLDTYSKRKLMLWYSFIRDKEKEGEFKSSFEYIYTSDQNIVIEEILLDMNKEKPMDRLLIWDVWFWKTEVAFNAIYNCFINKKQSILLSPLVVLTYEHYEKSLDRFRDFWMNIKVLTRLESNKSVSNTLTWLENWTIDLVIWTHKLLSESIKYKKLWLMIIDEEHKFGALDKEKIKKMKNNIDILSMSATPIPRSLNMALSSLKDMSIIKTAPYGRQNISTLVSPFSENSIYDAMNKEFERSWQVFFIHNRVTSIWIIEKLLTQIFPDKKIAITHWQLPGSELEKRIIDFKHKKYDILLSTTVIENWIDFSNVNTIIINNAESFWLSTIHQLRWRVWRSDRKWYCHLLYKKQNLKPEQVDRLKTIVNYSYLWAWFEIAMKDLEIRWGGDLLGIKQSGQVSEIWVNLFIKMVEEKIEELKKITQPNKNTPPSIPPLPGDGSMNINTKIDLNIESYLDNSFFGSELDKINFYRELESIKSIDELNDIISDFKSINPDLSTPANNLFKLLKLKILASNYKITNIKKVWINYQLDFDKSITLEELKKFLILDKEVVFSFISITRLRSEVKKFWSNEENFIKYLFKVFEKKIASKIRLKKKK